jgi:hypothetical protein
MNIEFQNTLDDILALNWYHHRTSPAARRTLLLFQYGLPVAIVLVVVIITFAAGWSLFTIVPAVVLALAWFAFVPQMQKRNLQKQIVKLYAEGRDRGIVTGHKVSINSSSIADRTDRGETKTAWKDVDKVVATEKHVFIYIGPESALIVPRGAFPGESEYSAFVDTAMRYHRAAAP